MNVKTEPDVPNGKIEPAIPSVKMEPDVSTIKTEPDIPNIKVESDVTNNFPVETPSLLTVVTKQEPEDTLPPDSKPHHGLDDKSTIPM